VSAGSALNRAMRRLWVVGLAVLVLPAYAATGSELFYVGNDGTIGLPSARDAAAAGTPAPTPPSGLYGVRLDARTGHLTSLGLQVSVGRATWQVAHPRRPVIYTVADSGGGLAADSVIYSLSVDAATGKLAPLARVGAGGRDATYLALDPAAGTLLVANHGSGDVTALPVQSDGSAGAVASAQKTTGTGPHRRQTMPQPHSMVVDRAGRHVIAADFGADRLYLYRLDPKTHALTAAATPTVALPAGSGPRHLAFDPRSRYLYLNTELTAQVRVYRWDAAREQLDPVQTVASYPAGYADSAEPSSSELALSRDGRFLYVSLRGNQNSLVVYAVDARSGQLQEIQRIGSGGETPRSFAIDPTGRWMVVTNQASDAINVFAIDPRTGRLAATGDSVPIPKPVSLVFTGR